MLSWVYSSFTFVISIPLAGLFMLSARGRARLYERFGFWNSRLRECVWLHGASMGEMNGLIPIIKQIRSEFPSLKILVSATSVTGLERVKDLVDEAHLLPFDSRFYYGLAARRLALKAFVFSETELWPALLAYLSKKEVPLYLVNGRISDYSYPRYQSMRPLFARVLARLAAVLVSDARSAERFISLGAAKEKVVVTGNAKYDLTPAVGSSDEAFALKREYFCDDAPVLVLGSIRPGEEEFWFRPLAEGFGRGSLFNVIVAPRHQEKFDWFEQKLGEYGLSCVRRSRGAGAQSAPSVILLDTMGELGKVYSFADVSFVGGSMADYGGHNPLEPAAYRSCVAMGVYSKNVAELTTLLDERGGLVRLPNVDEVRQLLARLAANDPGLKGVGQRAFEVWRESCGATGRIVEVIRKPLRE